MWVGASACGQSVCAKANHNTHIDLYYTHTCTHLYHTHTLQPHSSVFIWSQCVCQSPPHTHLCYTHLHRFAPQVFVCGPNVYMVQVCVCVCVCDPSICICGPSVCLCVWPKCVLVCVAQVCVWPKCGYMNQLYVCVWPKCVYVWSKYVCMCVCGLSVCVCMCMPKSVCVWSKCVYVHVCGIVLGPQTLPQNVVTSYDFFPESTEIHFKFIWGKKGIKNQSKNKVTVKIS